MPLTLPRLWRWRVSLKPRAWWHSNRWQVRKPSIESVVDLSNREVADRPRQGLDRPVVTSGDLFRRWSRSRILTKVTAKDEVVRVLLGFVVQTGHPIGNRIKADLFSYLA